MAAGFGSELIRNIKPKMKAELIVQPTISLEIKLRLEKLRLAELICSGESQASIRGDHERAQGVIASWRGPRAEVRPVSRRECSMPLTLYYHPLASFCHKVLIALYENGTPFEARIVDLGRRGRAARCCVSGRSARSPCCATRARAGPCPRPASSSSTWMQHYPGPVPLLPSRRGRARGAAVGPLLRSVRQVPMQKIVIDRLRLESERDARRGGRGGGHAARAYACSSSIWRGGLGGGDGFSLADCAAAPALFYAEIVVPFAARHPGVAAYYERLVDRPSVARTIVEARPYLGPCSR